MLLDLLVIINLISPFITQIYAPMSKKTFEFDVEDICLYQNSDSDYIYVEPCEKGYSCNPIINALGSSSFPILHICQEYSKAGISFGSHCSEDDDCEDNLNCMNQICTVNENDEAFHINNNYYCSEELIPILDSGHYYCKKREDYQMTNLCFNYDKDTSTTTEAWPDYNKIPGNIVLDDEDNGYQKLKVSADSIGSVKDGDFVENELACKSGFALNFYADNTLETPTSPVYPIYKKCVQFSGFELKGPYCNIKYTLNKVNYNYDVNKVSNDLITNDFADKNAFCDSFKYIKTKLELFKQYVNKANELAEECKKKKYYDEPYTCKNDELRRLMYFYNHVEQYLIYKNEEEVMEFLLQKEYPDYGVKFSKTDNSKYIQLDLILLLSHSLYRLARTQLHRFQHL